MCTSLKNCLIITLQSIPNNEKSGSKAMKFKDFDTYFQTAFQKWLRPTYAIPPEERLFIEWCHVFKLSNYIGLEMQLIFFLCILWLEVKYIFIFSPMNCIFLILCSVFSWDVHLLLLICKFFIICLQC